MLLTHLFSILLHLVNLSLVCSFNVDNDEHSVENSLLEEDLAFLKTLKSYEIVKITKKDKNSQNVKKQSRDDKNPARKNLFFQYEGKEFILDLQKNRNLISSGYLETHYLETGEAVSKQNSHNCFYQGHVRGYWSSSNVAISTCDGVQGYFSIKDTVNYIRPLKTYKKFTQGSVLHVIYKQEQVQEQLHMCGVEHTKETPAPLWHEQKRRHRRSIHTDMKYLEIYLINDKSQFDAHDSNVTKTELRAKTAVNIADSIYRPLNIRLGLIGMETWSQANNITVTTDVIATLDNLKVLKKNNLTQCDHALLLSHLAFTGGTVGYAPKLSMCRSDNSAVIRDHSTDVNLVASTIAHEIGHNFGMSHETYDGSCTCEESECIMNAVLSSFITTKWSNCSLTTLYNTLENGYGMCLFNPIELYSDSECGNAFVEDGEECDCGSEEECDALGNNCCDPSTCLLLEGKQCHEGECCENCQFKAQGFLCRNTSEECDLLEVCPGNSGHCPKDTYKRDGYSCAADKGRCYQGVCRYGDRQCEELWGTGATEALKCYLLNGYGSIYGFCKETSDGVYQACASADKRCGKVHCVNPPNTEPIIGQDRIFSFLTAGSEKCWSTNPYMGYNLPRAGVKQDGTICGTDKVCMDNKCVFEADVFNKTCNCSNGVCNNEGNCHCDDGYECPYCNSTCSFRPQGYPGGSVDNGQACYCQEEPTTTTSLPPTTATTKTTISTTLGDESVQGKREDEDDDTVVVASVVPVVVILVLAMAGLAYWYRDRLLQQCNRIESRSHDYMSETTAPQNASKDKTGTATEENVKEEPV